MKEYDVFISHASEDKGALVRPLAAALRAAGLVVWYDEAVLRVGGNLRRSIDEGLSRSRHAVVVLSKAFFEKNWTQWELDGLVQRQIGNPNVILPVWHEIEAADVLRYSPSLANLIALKTADGLANVIHGILEVVQQRSPARDSFRRQPSAGKRITSIQKGNRPVDGILPEFERVLTSNNDVSIRDFILDNPRLLNLVLNRFHHRSIVQTRPAPISSYSFDALAISAPQGFHVDLVIVGSARVPPFNADGSWSDELAEAIGLVSGWSRASGPQHLSSVASDIVKQNAGGWGSNPGRYDSEERLASALSRGRYETDCILLFGRQGTFDETIRHQFHRNRLADVRIELRTYDRILRELYASCTRVQLGEPIRLTTFRASKEPDQGAFLLDRNVVADIRKQIMNGLEDQVGRADLRIVEITLTVTGDFEKIPGPRASTGNPDHLDFDMTDDSRSYDFLWWSSPDMYESSIAMTELEARAVTVEYRKKKATDSEIELELVVSSIRYCTNA